MAGESDMLQFTELQRVRHDLVTEQQQLDNYFVSTYPESQSQHYYKQTLASCPKLQERALKSCKDHRGQDFCTLLS